MKSADGVGAAAYAGDHRIRQAAFARQHLRARLVADDALELAHHGGIGMRAERGAEQIIGVAHIGDPVAQGFVDGILQGLGAGLDAAHLGSHQAHAEDVQRLALHVFRAHVDDAVEAEAGADRGRGDAVLSRAGFGDDAPLAHAPRQQHLAQGVVDLVRTGVAEVFALQKNSRAAGVFAEPLGVVQRRGPAAEFGEQSA